MMHGESMYDVHEEYPDYDYRGDERYHSPPDEPSRAGAIAWIAFGYILVPLVAVFGGLVYTILSKLGGGKCE